MNTVMSSTDKLEIRIMKLIEEKFDKFEVSLNARFDAVEHKIDKMVSREEFEPVRNLVYGGAGTILVAVLGALLGLVFIK